MYMTNHAQTCIFTGDMPGALVLLSTGPIKQAAPNRQLPQVSDPGNAHGQVKIRKARLKLDITWLKH